MRKTVIEVCCAILAAAAALVPAVRAAAADSGAGGEVTLQIVGGYGGVVPRTGWAPMQVDVTNHGPDTRATIRLSVTSSQNGFNGGGFVKGAPFIAPALGLGGPVVPIPVASPSGGSGGRPSPTSSARSCPQGPPSTSPPTCRPTPGRGRPR